MNIINSSSSQTAYYDAKSSFGSRNRSSEMAIKSVAMANMSSVKAGQTPKKYYRFFHLIFKSIQRVEAKIDAFYKHPKIKKVFIAIDIISPLVTIGKALFTLMGKKKAESGEPLVGGVQKVSKIEKYISWVPVEALSKAFTKLNKVIRWIPFVPMLLLPKRLIKIGKTGKATFTTQSKVERVEKGVKLASLVRKETENVTRTTEMLGNVKVISAAKVAWCGLALSIIGIVGAVISMAGSTVELVRINSLKKHIHQPKEGEYKRVLGVKEEKIEKAKQNDLKKTDRLLRNRIRKKIGSHTLNMMIQVISIVAIAILIGNPVAPVGLVLVVVATSLALSRMLFDKYDKRQFKKDLFSISSKELDQGIELNQVAAS